MYAACMYRWRVGILGFLELVHSHVWRRDQQTLPRVYQPNTLPLWTAVLWTQR
ncbi:hypothetical protein DPMN_032100 [Dreissena polymorpha]|uniref:Uncharacterized protein n=1 Tax=Dreissena polymorpha TaxID=45954 RepID=A0A9D4M343_DREPO|nr:hypothetical protein DPMN_032100 [Dreissena polymorpha]